MAFRDQNEKITIDEIAAQQDIQALQNMKSYLESVKEKITSVNLQSQEFHGETGVTINENCLNIIRQIDTLLQKVEETIQAVRATVEKYKQIDQDLRGLIG